LGVWYVERKYNKRSGWGVLLGIIFISVISFEILKKYYFTKTLVAIFSAGF
jgi:hypothetical protein